MRIVVCHSSFVQCGIRQYGEQLDRELMLRVETPSFTYGELASLVATTRPGDVVLFHFEPSLLDPAFATTLEALRRKSVKTALVCHWFNEGVLSYGADLFIVHRDYKIADPRVQIIPLGCPVYEISNERREALRAAKGWSQKTVATTVGFLSGWKQTADVAVEMLKAIRDPRVLIYVHGSRLWGGDASPGESALKTLERRSGGRMVFCSDYLLEEDLLDLAAASDVGFIYHGVDTNSVSAATKQFVSARCPLVVTSSTHASDLKKGVSRVPNKDVFPFCREVARVAGDATLRGRLKTEMEEVYGEINLEVVAQKYIDVLSKLRG
jgi:hypothetical protein